MNKLIYHTEGCVCIWINKQRFLFAFCKSDIKFNINIIPANPIHVVYDVQKSTYIATLNIENSSN
jgi:hypothetical protein